MKQDAKGPAHGLRGNTEKQPDLRDTQGGTFDELPGVKDQEQVREERTPHEDAQWGADVRAMPEPERNTLPDGLFHREGPLNKTTGRRPTGENQVTEKDKGHKDQEPRATSDEPTDGPMAQKNREKMQRQDKAEGERR